MKKITGIHYTGERAVFRGRDLDFCECLFDDGESPLKESENIKLTDCTFGWKYPLWYSKDVEAEDCLWQDTARAGVWYTENIVIRNTKVLAPKNFRRCKDIILENIELPNAQETLWACEDVELNNVKVSGNYFGMNCSRVTVDNLDLDGDYGFDGARDIVIRNSSLKTKDAFWNCENVTVINSTIVGEYFGWNSKNITLINCEIESLQGFCYIEGLKLVNCKLGNTTLSFEYCKNIDADIVGTVDSVKNPISGVIVADGIGELILEEDKVDPKKTKIVVREKA
ncbi:MAG: DUF3737 family protein [Clostridiales bacterium]|nr:DUF3737 family protein [Clostridiales bacterium]